MSKIEKEVKILDINVNETIQKLNLLGAKDKGVKDQKLYTYDVPTIYHRYLEIMKLLSSKKALIKTVAKTRLRTLLDEFSDLVENSILNTIYQEMNISNFEDLYRMDATQIKKTIKSSITFKKQISKKLINPNKWIRLRQSNERVELTIKHIYQKNNSSIQRVKEIEISVSDFKETNLLLESLGIVHRNYQEKIRHSFKYKGAEIEIDEWPLLEPYIEIECDNMAIIKEIIAILGYEQKEIVSINTEQLYRRKGINILEMSELKF